MVKFFCFVFKVIDIGTGYFVEKDIEASKEYFNKKVKYVTEQMEKVQVKIISVHSYIMCHDVTPLNFVATY